MGVSDIYLLGGELIWVATVLIRRWRHLADRLLVKPFGYIVLMILCLETRSFSVCSKCVANHSCGFLDLLALWQIMNIMGLTHHGAYSHLHIVRAVTGVKRYFKAPPRNSKFVTSRRACWISLDQQPIRRCRQVYVVKIPKRRLTALVCHSHLSPLTPQKLCGTESKQLVVVIPYCASLAD